MAETDILNPSRGFDETLGFNANWSYGTPRQTAANTVFAKARLGSPFARDVANQGYAFELYFIDKPYAAVQRLVQFYQQFKNGYFTLIDWDGGGRHHVGRFTTAPNPQQTQNGKYTVQRLIFEEVPTARMVQYPNDWDASSHFIYVVDDFLNPRAGFQGSWIATTPASYLYGFIASTNYYLSSGLNPHYILQINLQGAQLFPAGTQVVLEGLTAQPQLNGYVGVVDISNSGDFIFSGSPTGARIGVFTETGTAAVPGLSAPGPAAYLLQDLNAAAGDFAQVQYVGWGFQVAFPLAANQGICNVELDGVAVLTSLDLSTGTCTPATNAGIRTALSIVRGVSYLTLTVPNVALDMHRVAVVATGTKNANATATTVIFPPVQVMH